mgnify:FL=1
MRLSADTENRIRISQCRQLAAATATVTAAENAVAIATAAEKQDNPDY